MDEKAEETQSPHYDLNTLQTFISLQLQVVDSLKPALQQMRNAIDTLSTVGGNSLVLSPQWEFLRQSILQTGGLYHIDCPSIVVNTTKGKNTMIKTRSRKLLEKQEQTSFMKNKGGINSPIQPMRLSSHLSTGKGGKDSESQTFETENGTVVTVKTIQPKRRGRGRPPKQLVEDSTVVSTSSGKKRGRGRPPKRPVEDSAIVSTLSGKKRGRGRPPKQSVEDNVMTDNETVSTSSEKRLRSRSSIPQTEENQVDQEDIPNTLQSSTQQPLPVIDQPCFQLTPEKNTHSMPSNLNPLNEVDINSPNNNANELIPVKRGRGRPRKNLVINSNGMA